MNSLPHLLPTLFVALILQAPAWGENEANGPNVFLLTVDTLRGDRLSINGYERPTSPALDALLRKGASLSDARTVEPLTAPAVDGAIQAALELVTRELSGDFLLAFAADHGESLGEHGYWGHGRHLDDVCLRIPMGLVWPGRIPAIAVEAQDLITDLAPCILAILSLPAEEAFGGYSWAGVLAGDAAPRNRVTEYQGP
jgi:arylsulfatase A-like enzyme